MGCAFFSLAVLVASNNRTVDSWTVQPTVYLAIAAAIANSAIAFAHARAVPIAWWHAALEGTTIRSLHRQWKTSGSIAHAIANGRHLSLALTTTILVSIMIVDGPLLQRAASVVVATQSKMVQLSLSLSPEIPTGFSGILQYNNLVYYKDAVASCMDWVNQAPIPLPVQPRCEGVCVGKILGPGLVKNRCHSTDTPITSDMWHDPNATWVTGSEVKAITNSTNPLLEVTLAPYGGAASPPIKSEAVYLYTGQANVLNSSGSYSATYCYWVPAIIEYETQFDAEDHVKLLQSPGSTGKVVALVNNTSSVGVASVDTTASGTSIVNAAAVSVATPNTIDFFSMFHSAFFFADGIAMAPPLTSGSTWNTAQWTFNSVVMKYQNFSVSEADVQFSDPAVDIIHALNEVMFRAAVKATKWSNVTSLIDKGLSINQTTTANQTVTHNVYRSNFGWYAAATVLEIIVVMSILPMFWGWWRLDSELDLSPFAVGLALDAPLLRDSDSDQGIKSVLKRKRYVHVKYGPIAAEEDSCECTKGSGLGKVERGTRMGLAESCKIISG